VNTVPFEDLDVQLGRPVTIDAEAAYRKVVGERRGGWCYELNGLFGWALERIGFEVRRVSAGVMRVKQGDAQLGTHLCLLVTLDQDYLADVGFGSSLREPLALREGRRVDAPYTVELTRIEDGFWRFVEHLDGDPFSFDFLPEPADEAVLAAQSDRQQTDPESPFVRHLVVQRRDGDAHITVRGKELTRTDAIGATTSTLKTADEFRTTLKDAFDLDLPEAARLWQAG
jgi:N-hydroxyarylamine O-acetyltransferase